MISAAASAFENFDQSMQKKSLIGRTSLSSSGELSLPPYEVVPESRPVIVIGPALRGYEVTDLMHKALYNYLKKRFAGRICVYKTHADIGQCKRHTRVNQGDKDKFNISKAASARPSPEILREVERIYDLTRGLNIVIIDCDVINHPSQLTDCSLAPIIVYIRMQSGILEKLIKLRGAKRKNMGAQVLGLQKLLQCNEDQFDLILDEAIFEDACEHLGEYLDQYWRDLRPSDPDRGLPNEVGRHDGYPTEDPSKPLLPKTPSSLSPRHRDTHSPRSSLQHGPSGSRAVPVVRKVSHPVSQGSSRQRSHDSHQRKLAITGKAPELGNIEECDAGYQERYEPDNYKSQTYYGQEEQYDANQYGSEGFAQDAQYGSAPYQGYGDQYDPSAPQGYPQGYEQTGSSGYRPVYNEQNYRQDYGQGYGQELPYQEYPLQDYGDGQEFGGPEYMQGSDYQQQYTDEYQQGVPTRAGGDYGEEYYRTGGYNW